MAEENRILFRGLFTNAGSRNQPEGFFVEFENLTTSKFGVIAPREGLDKVVPQTFEESEVIAVSGSMFDHFEGSAADSNKSFSKLVLRPIGTEIALSGGFSPAHKLMASGVAPFGSGAATIAMISGQMRSQFTTASGANTSGYLDKFYGPTTSGMRSIAPPFPEFFVQATCDGQGHCFSLFSGSVSPDVEGKWACGYQYSGSSGTLSNDQYATAQAFIVSTNFGDSDDTWPFMGVAVRCSNATTTTAGKAYLFGLEPKLEPFTSPYYFYTPRLWMVSGFYGTQIAQGSALSGISSGTLITITAEGTAIRGYVSGIMVVSGTNSIITSGVPGIGGQIDITTSTSGAVGRIGIQNWEGGPLNLSRGRQNNPIKVCGGFFQYSIASGTIQDDQFCTMSLHELSTFNSTHGEDAKLGPAIRGTEYANSTSGSCYWVGATRRPESGSGTLVLHKVVNGVQTELTRAGCPLSFSPYVGLKIMAVGSTITCLVNDVSYIVHTDSSITSGVPGIAGEAQFEGSLGVSGYHSSFCSHAMSGGSNAATNSNSLGVLSASGYVAAVAAFSPLGRPSYCYVDASGTIKLMEYPERG